MCRKHQGWHSKSTLTTCLGALLANQGKRVALLDADPQATTKGWLDRRNKFQPDAAKVQAFCVEGDVYNPARDLAKVYDEVLVDTAGSSNGELTTALLAAQVVLVPFRPSVPDLDAMTTVNKLLRDARNMRVALDKGPRALAVVSLASTNPRVTEVAEAREYMAKFPEIELLSVFVRDRKEYRNSMLAGLGVTESSNQLAKSEIEALAAILYPNEIDI